MITADVQTLEPGRRIVLYTLDAREFPGGGVARFHQHLTDPDGALAGAIVWQGNTFNPWPIQAVGFERTSTQQPTPKLSVGNVDRSITALCLAFDDLVGAVLTRQVTFAKYLDPINFPGGVNPTADPGEEYPPETFYIERKVSETVDVVEFELSTPLEYNGVQLPRRQIVANQCPFQYRQAGCAYIGPPVATEFDVPTSNPLLDKCGRRLQSCRMRQWPDNVLNFGGHPAAGLVRQ